MGVEKNLNDSHAIKTNGIGLYRPPALRNQISETKDFSNGGSASFETASDATTVTKPPNPSTATTSVSCSTSPTHSNENGGFESSVTSTRNTAAEILHDRNVAYETSNATQQSNSKPTRRERRPDRAVYVPRARRSQTTPPLTTTTTTTTLPAAAPADTASSNDNRQLAVTSDDPTTDLVCNFTSSKVDGSTSRKSTKNKERRERPKKTTILSAKISKITEKSTNILEDNFPVQPSTEINSKTTNQNCDNNQQEEEQQQKEQKTNDKTNFESVSITTTNTMNLDNCEHRQQNHNTVGSAAISVLRIEDVVGSPVEKSHPPAKCDFDTQELQRASKEINRSNRRIIKQTFVSNVLEIPEKIEHDISFEKLQTNHANIRPNVDSATEEEDDDYAEDDWESMFDESGDCLDPKILQELTASVGKVKIELPKMDYSAYLVKQSILNEEEFPHVLEVSNFPVEFKNQDLLMVFSQYKESGFDIKWVDDTHALAVFSSSRIAAEVLTMGHPFVVLKPLAEATMESRVKAKKCATSMQPYRPRPETCAALARRLVSGALGVRLKTADAERENEKRVLREAKERKMLAAKQRDEIWES